MKLRELAHARAGDKGDTSQISVIAYDPNDYAFLCAHVTAERVRGHFAEIARGEVARYELPGLAALNFVLRRALAGGVTCSLRLDPHGKCLGSVLLELELPDRAQTGGSDRSRSHGQAAVSVPTSRTHSGGNPASASSLTQHAPPQEPAD